MAPQDDQDGYGSGIAVGVLITAVVGLVALLAFAS